MWNYVTNFTNYLIPHPNMRPFAEDLNFLTSNHVIGIFQQGDAFNVRAGDMLPLRCWLLAHLLWDPSKDQSKLREEFLSGYFGAAGPALGRYLNLVNSAADQSGFRRGCYAGDIRWINDDMMRAMDKLFDEAANSVANDAILLKRVQRERLVIDHLHLLRDPSVQKKNRGNPSTQPAREAYEEHVRQYAAQAKAMGVKHASEGQDLGTYIKKLLDRGR
jgi:hypothetical protein